MGVLGTALAGLLMLAEQSGGGMATENTASPKYHNYAFESACGGFVVRVRFRNGRNGRSRVDLVSMDGRPLPGATKTLNRFAARRAIDQVGIMDCGMDPLRPVFRGTMTLRKPEAEPFSRNNSFYFRIIHDGKGWRFIPDRRS
jgi:hypothetical protein